MNNAYEEALHNGYTPSDMAADMKEAQARSEALGCHECFYLSRNSRTCAAVLEGELPRCPYFKKGGQ